MLDEFSTILFDMNQTFMFDSDRFGSNEDFSVIYRQLGGKMDRNRVNQLIFAAYNYLDICYSDPKYRESFPSLKEALVSVSATDPLSGKDLELLVETFAHHELGSVPPEYAETIHQLSKYFRLGLVIDIWSPKTLWVETLKQSGVLDVCESTSFSSDCRMVKPSPLPFLSVLAEMQVDHKDAVVIGDSITRDLGGAVAAGLNCILVGGAKHPSALGSVNNLIELVNRHPLLTPSNEPHGC